MRKFMNDFRGKSSGLNCVAILFQTSQKTIGPFWRCRMIAESDSSLVIEACLLRSDPYTDFTSGAPATSQSAPIKVEVNVVG